METVLDYRIGVKKRACIFLIVFGIGLGISGRTGAPAASAEDQASGTNRFVHDVMENEMKAQKADVSLWQFRQNKSENGKVELFEIVETRQGDLQRLISINGKALDPEPARKEDARIGHLLSDRHAFQNEHRKQQQDVEQEQKLLRMLPDAFTFEDAGQEGKLRKISFNPNPSFHPPSREGEVFHHMSGTLWLEVDQKRLARMTGRLASEVNFGWGILGHLAKGGTFDVEQREVGKGYWELTRIDVNMNGKALFFKTINVKQNVRNSDFKPVSAGVTLQQAAQMLKRDSADSANGRP
jgi:hypothetical protein